MGKHQLNLRQSDVAIQLQIYTATPYRRSFSIPKRVGVALGAVSVFCDAVSFIIQLVGLRSEPTAAISSIKAKILSSSRSKLPEQHKKEIGWNRGDRDSYKGRDESNDDGSGNRFFQQSFIALSKITGDNDAQSVSNTKAEAKQQFVD